MDLFSVFHKAHQVYLKLQQDDPHVNLSLPALESGGTAFALDLSVQIPKDAPPLEKSLDGRTPGQLFGKQPQEIRGPLSVFTKKLQNYVFEVGKLPVTLYKQYAQALTLAVLSRNLPQDMVTAFAAILKEYPDKHALPEEFEVKMKFSPPARLVIFSQACGSAMVYDFCTNTLTLSGFPDPMLVDYASHIKFGDPSVELKVKVREGLLTEACAILLKLPEARRAVLTERVEVFQQTVDDMLDQIIQKLVLLDVLDAVQDIILGDDGEIYICFDPVLERDEIDSVVVILKEVYPQTLLVDTPETSDSPWWVVEIAKVSDTAVQVSNAGVGEPEPRNAEGIIAKDADDTLSTIAKEVDVNAALASISKEK